MSTAVHATPENHNARGFKRGLFSINFKFGGITSLLLLSLLTLVTLIVNAQLRVDLSREVSERARTVARNIAAKAVELLVQKDDLTLAVLLKDSVEDASVAAASAPGTGVGAFLSDLKASFSTRKEIKNEGVSRIVIIKLPTKDDPHPGVVDSGSVGASPDASSLPVSAPDARQEEPFPVFKQDGKEVYDVRQPVLVNEKPLGEVRLYLRKDVITDAVRVATTRLVAVMLLSLALGALGLTIVVRLLMRPVGHLVRGVNAVAAGNFNVHIGIKRDDELGDLVEAYNGMAKSLKEKEAIQEALAKYTSKDLVNQMLTDKSKLEMGGKRVHATIFFSVVRGMHALSQTMSAEDYVGLVNEFLEVKTDAVMRNGGSIDKFIGDEVMALWGLNGEDPTEMAFQATKAAVETQDAVAALNKVRIGRGEQPFLVSIGINNGEVVSGNMGSSVKMDYTVLGGNVNLAARLGLVAAQGGQSIISHSVYSLVADRFQIEKLAPMQLKGIKEPVPLYWPRKIVK
jgi:class 3 adenylate cyclase